MKVCFIPDNNYRRFLKEKLKVWKIKLRGGNFITVDGKKVGTHDDLSIYTISKRKIGVSLGSQPTYVIGINPEDNTVVVGNKDDLKKQEMYIEMSII